MQAERTSFLNQRRPWSERFGRDLKAAPTLSEADQERLAWYDGEIRSNEELLADLGGLPVDGMDLRPGDVVRVGGDLVRVNKVSKKTLRGDILDKPHLGEYFSRNRQFDLTEVTELVKRADASA